ncbi:MAG: DMT family transporter, partial [Gammaproteobacteria bacterium]
MSRRERMDATGAAILVVFSALLGLNQALVKLVNAGFAPVFQGGLRSLCAALVVAAWMVLRGRAPRFAPGTRLLGALNGTLFALEFAFLFLALELSSVSRASLLFYTMPFFVALGAHWLFPAERLTPARLAGLALAVAGVALVLAERPGGGEGAWLGVQLHRAAAGCGDIGAEVG